MRLEPAKTLFLTRRRLQELIYLLLSWEVAFLSLTAAVVTLIALGYIGFYAVPTSSMEPVIPKGSLIIVAHVDVSDVKIGDIALVVDRDLGMLVAHRVIGKDYANEELLVKGDAVPSTTGIPFRDFRGIVLFHVPYLGYLFLNRQLMAALLISLAIAVYLLIRERE